MTTNNEPAAESEGGEDDPHDDCLCCPNCLTSIRNCINRMYCRINRTAFASGGRTNHTYIESCEMAAVTFSTQQHKFFNIGGNLTVFLTLFSTLLFIFVNYLVVYETIFISSYPSKLSTIGPSILLSAGLGVVIGQIMCNLFTASLDCLLFCYLLEKKNGVDFSDH